MHPVITFTTLKLTFNTFIKYLRCDLRHRNHDGEHSDIVFSPEFFNESYNLPNFIFLQEDISNYGSSSESLDPES